MVNVIKKVGGPNCLIITKTFLWKQSKWFGNVLIRPHSLYPKLDFNNLSKLTFIDTSRLVRTRPNNCVFQVENNMFNVLNF